MNAASPVPGLGATLMSPQPLRRYALLADG